MFLPRGHLPPCAETTSVRGPVGSPRRAHCLREVTRVPSRPSGDRWAVSARDGCLVWCFVLLACFICLPIGILLAVLWAGLNAMAHSRHPTQLRRISRAIIAIVVSHVVSEERVRRGQGASVGEGRLISLVSELYGHSAVRTQFAPPWLTGPGGGQMRVDVAVPSERLAFEYQGEGHDTPLQHLGGTRGLHEQRARDQRKRRLLAQHGWRLVEIWYDEPLTRAYLLSRVRASS